MKYARFGQREVSRLVLGSNNFGGQLDEESSIRIIRKALDAGINSIDTADVYTRGMSERVVGKALKGDREGVIVATKVGNQLAGWPEGADLSRKYIMHEVEQSLERLGTEYIDIYYMHRPDPVTPLEETLSAVDSLVREGKVRHVACSNFSVEQMERIAELQRSRGYRAFEAVQPQYNVVQSEAGRALLPYCAREGLAVFTYSPLMGGFLTGKYRAGAKPPEGSRGAYNPRFFQRVKSDSYYTAAERLAGIAREAGLSLPELALAWVLRDGSVTAPIVGASSPKHVEEACAVLDLNVPRSVFAEAEAAVSGL